MGQHIDDTVQHGQHVSCKQLLGCWITDVLGEVMEVMNGQRERDHEKEDRGASSDWTEDAVVQSTATLSQAHMNETAPNSVAHGHSWRVKSLQPEKENIDTTVDYHPALLQHSSGLSAHEYPLTPCSALEAAPYLVFRSKQFQQNG